MKTPMTYYMKKYDEKVSRDQNFPFEISAESFCSEKYMKYLQQVILDIETGKSKLVEHNLAED